MTAPDTDTPLVSAPETVELEKLLAEVTPGDWLYRPDHLDDWGTVKVGPFVICRARDPRMMSDEVLAAHRSNNSDPWEYNARLIALAPELAAETIALRAQAAKDKARIERLEAALREIAGIKEREKNCYPPDWHEQIAACPECQRYKDHPIQRGICDDHRKPIYAQEDHDRHETKILGYRAMGIARAALEDGE